MYQSLIESVPTHGAPFPAARRHHKKNGRIRLYSIMKLTGHQGEETTDPSTTMTAQKTICGLGRLRQFCG
jgi:hypothetical protein